MADQQVTSETTQQSPVAPPRTGYLSVRVAAFVAQLLVTVVMTWLVRRQLLSPEMVEKFKGTPEIQQLIQLIAETLPLGVIALQGWITTVFIKISGRIAEKKLDIIGDYHKQLVIAASPNTTQVVETTTKETETTT